MDRFVFMLFFFRNMNPINSSGGYIHFIFKWQNKNDFQVCTGGANFLKWPNMIQPHIPIVRGLIGESCSASACSIKSLHCNAPMGVTLSRRAIKVITETALMGPYLIGFAVSVNQSNYEATMHLMSIFTHGVKGLKHNESLSLYFNKRTISSPQM